MEREKEAAASGRPTPTTLSLRDKRWYYKGEGNANVVLAVPADGTVVRVMKADDSSAAAGRASLSTLVRYRGAVDRLFFAGCDYTDVPAPMAVSADELRDVDRRVRRDRPPDRRHKRLGWADGLVAVCPDYTALPPPPPPRSAPVYCVEVKPKQGWMHGADRAARAGGPLGAKCAFCAHQRLKLARGDVRDISRYCPLDLFSGRPGRARDAVRRLFRTPQNNLKVFVDGVPVPDGRDLGRTAGEAFGDVRRSCAFLAAVLLGREPAASRRETRETPATDDDDDEGSPTTDDDDDGSRPCDFDAVPMARHSVLHRVLEMQKMQSTGFEAVRSAYERSRPEQQQQQFGHVDRLCAAAGPADVSCPVDRYLVAATAQDCSVFVAFSEVAPDDRAERPERVVRFDGRRYAVRVKVSDLDPKPRSTVEKHRKRNDDVLAACKRHLVDRGRDAGRSDP